MRHLTATWTKRDLGSRFAPNLSPHPRLFPPPLGLFPNPASPRRRRRRRYLAFVAGDPALALCSATALRSPLSARCRRPRDRVASAQTRVDLWRQRSGGWRERSGTTERKRKGWWEQGAAAAGAEAVAVGTWAGRRQGGTRVCAGVLGGGVGRRGRGREGSNGALTYAQVKYIRHRQLLYYRDEFGDRGENIKVDPSLVFENPRLRNAYIALQSWKQAIISDPLNFTANWVGPNVCKYKGVFCTNAIDNSSIHAVAGIDLNHGDIAGYLPEELGLLSDLALFHINSNRFCGTIPHKFNKLKLLFELDLSNNRFAGRFPGVVLQLPSLKFLDLRFNEFEGVVPRELFDKDLDAIFINNNRFTFNLPDNFGNSPVSVIVVANNRFHGCIPASLGNMGGTLNEIIFMNNGLRSCLPKQIGLLRNVTVFDVSFNELMGSLPSEVGEMKAVEQLNVAHNMLSGLIPESVCSLPKLENFTFSYNFFSGEPPKCLGLKDFDDRRNCLANRPGQRTGQQCREFLSRPVDCASFKCAPFVPSPGSPPVVSPPVVSPTPVPVHRPLPSAPSLCIAATTISTARLSTAAATTTTTTTTTTYTNL
ncbi:hypothetical protein Syun_025907 [Stephania yunnanensis]|uniref:Cell wall hydroxyproline-rich glycoprotein n=1 Tax=Stephania yunnanensis TaxID=152371 RepID=A0AAP0HV85_9MAGN